MISRIVFIAAAAAYSPMAEGFSMNPSHQYFDMICHMNQQQNEQPPAVEAQIIEKTTSEEQIKAPPLPQTNNPFTLLGLSVAATFDAVRRAYKEKVKVYHPDKLVGPDASPEERKKANWDFARINSAYDILKRRENEEVYEYEMFVDGEQVRRSVRVDKEQRYRRDAHYIDYDRIRQVAEYRKTHPKKKMWYEEEHEYQPTINGFERGASYCSNQKWYNHLEMFEYEPEMSCPPYNGYASTQERMRRTFETNNNNEDRWWQEDEPPSSRFSEEGNSYSTYNDRWYREAVENEFDATNRYDNYEFEDYDPTDVWYKQFDDEPRINGQFRP